MPTPTRSTQVNRARQFQGGKTGFDALLCCALLAGGIIASGFAPVAGAWGARASEQDLAEMNSDYVKMLIGLRNLRQLNQDAVDKRRQEPLMGVDKDPSSKSLGDLVLEHLQEFEAIINDSGLRVIRNPSASCQVAAAVVGIVLDQERQFQLMGVETDFGRGGLFPADGSASGQFTLHGLVGEVEDRCVEDALDQCLESHTTQPLIYLATVYSRQLEMLGVEEAAFLQKVARKMEDCGVYKLHLRSESTQVHQYGPKFHIFLNMTFEADPRLQLVFATDTEWTMGSWLTRVRIDAEFPNDSDMMGNLLKATFIAVDCGGTPVPTCPKLDGAFHYGYASIRIEDMSVRYEMTRAVVNAEQSDFVNNGKYAARPIKFETLMLPNMTENRLVLKLIMPVILEPLLYSIDGQRGEDGSVPYLFTKSHPELAAISNWEHRGTPVFRTQLKGDGQEGPMRRFSDSLMLELEHTPQASTNLPPIVDPNRVPATSPH